MIKPLVLGDKTFHHNIIQGPLAGVSCAPFRALAWRYSQPAFSCTEMISCKTILNSSIQSQQRYIKKDPAEGPVSFQLSSNNPVELAEATKRVTDYGADLIDLNCGCPMNKIRSKGTGSRLLEEPAQLYQLITAMKQNTHLPVSIKIRVDGRTNDVFNKTIAQVVADAGADFLVVHGRHWSEDYDTPCAYEQIRFFVEELAIPVIGNGDIADLLSLQKMLDTGCAGVMIGRAGVGQPWLIGNLIAQMQQQMPHIPSANQVGQVLIEHVIQLISLLRSEKSAIFQARKFAKYYARSLENRAEFIAEVNRCNDLQAFQNICQIYFN